MGSPQINILMQIYIISYRHFVITDHFNCYFPSYSTLSFHASVSYSQSFYELLCLYHHISPELTWNSKPNRHSRVCRKTIRVMTTFRITVFSKPGISELIKHGYILLNLRESFGTFLWSRLWMWGIWQRHTVDIRKVKTSLFRDGKSVNNAG